MVAVRKRRDDLFVRNLAVLRTTTTATISPRFNGLVVMISVSHWRTDGLQFDPGLNHFLSLHSTGSENFVVCILFYF